VTEFSKGFIVESENKAGLLQQEEDTETGSLPTSWDFSF
jgi:hypothetical protein